jgi:hypothetical protein
MAQSVTATSPGLPGGGNKGKLQFEPNPKKKDEWLASDGRDRPPARIWKATNVHLGETTEKYYVYRGAIYLGSDDALPKAIKRADTQTLSDRHITDKAVGDTPAFLFLSRDERTFSREQYSAARRAAGLPDRREPYMAQYDKLDENELARAYNTLVDTARAKGLDRFRPVTRFKDKNEGLKYIELIESSIRAREVAERAAKLADKTPRQKGEATPQPVPEKPEQTAKDDDTMASVKKGAKKGAKKASAKKAAKAPKAAAAKKEYERPTGKAGEFTAKLGTRPGTNRDKLALVLFANLGKMVPAEKVCKEVYGKSEYSPKINNVLNGLRDDIDAAKAPFNIKREDNAFGLFAGSK